MDNQETNTLEARSTELRPNRKVEALLAFAGEWAIDEQWGVAAAERYMCEIRLAGMSAGSVNMAERRALHQPYMFVPQGASFGLVQDRGLIRNAALTPPGSIAVVPLRGVMQSEGTISTPSIDSFVADLRAAYENDNIAAVVMEIESGGGQMTAGYRARNAVQERKRKNGRSKPVMAYVHMAGSAAYLTAAAADEIIASNTQARLGSIGALFVLDRAALSDARDNAIFVYGEKARDKNRESRAALSGDLMPYQRLANELTEEFRNEIASMRALRGSKAQVDETLSGGMFSAAESKMRGLADGIGDMNYVLARAEAWIKKYNG